MFYGLAASNSSGDLHGTYVKQTEALSLIRFCDKDKGKVLEALTGYTIPSVLNTVFL